MSADIVHHLQSTGVFETVRAETAAVYEKILFRSPTPRDLRQHVEHFLLKCGTSERAKEVVRDRTLLRTYLGIRPLFVEMDVINKCNIQCIMCHFSDNDLFKAKREEMSVEEFARFAEQALPFCHYFSLSCSAEPLLHSRLEELLAITGKYEVPDSLMYTNGLLLTEKVSHSIIHSKLTNLYISIDGASKETFERIRVGGKFDKLLANIAVLNRAKDRAGSTSPTLYFNIVLMRSNIRELPALIRLAAELRVAGVIACHLYNHAWAQASNETLEHDKELCNRSFDEARDVAEALGVYLYLPSKFAVGPERSLIPLDGPSERERITKINREVFWYLRKVFAHDAIRSCCQYPWNFLAILWSGEVFPCSAWSDGALGNIRTEAFEELWNNEKFRTLRAEHLSGSLRKTCRECPAFAMGSVDSPTALSGR